MQGDIDPVGGCRRIIPDNQNTGGRICAALQVCRGEQERQVSGGCDTDRSVGRADAAPVAGAKGVNDPDVVKKPPFGRGVVVGAKMETDYDAVADVRERSTATVCQPPVPAIQGG